jgi:iron complex outermembrane receptor protein
VTDAESGKPMYGATVRASAGEASSRQSGAITGPDGKYTVRALAPGRYHITITFLSYRAVDTTMTIAAGETVRLDAAMTQASLGMGEVVVSASRRPEKITEAPASVSVVNARTIQEHAALTPADHLRGIPGIDIVQSGLTQNNIVARGFNNAFSGTLTVLTDNRIASVPSLRLNAYNFIPVVNEDLQQIEIIRGPGSALYGPNAAQGVMNMITRSPFSSTGTWLSVAGGERSVLQGMVRHAGVIGDRFGYKISAQYMRGIDWPFTDTAETQARADFLADTVTNGHVNPDTLKIAQRDSTIERFGAEVRLDYIAAEDLTTILTVGINQAIRNLDITGVGAGQVRNWRYMYYQGRVLYKDLFIQAYLNQSDAGETYLLRTGAPIIDRSSLFVAQIQHSYVPTEIERLTYGADLFLTNPVTDSTITGRNEGNDNITEYGVYLQSETRLIDRMLQLVLAGRFDKHNRLDDPIFSPRAALVYTPLEDQTFRLTYNRAYTAPTTNDLSLDIIGNRASQSIPFNVRASSVPEGGFNFRLGSDGQPFLHSYPLFGADPAKAIGLGDASREMWPIIQALVKPELAKLGFPAGIDAIPAPSFGRAGVDLKVLNLSTRGFDPFVNVVDRQRVKPTINSTLELGYKGVIADRLSLSIDLYRSQYDNFIGPLEVITPNVFYRRDSLVSYFLEQFVASGTDSVNARTFAGLLADKISGIPLGTVTPEEAASDPSAVMLTSRNYGRIVLAGLDMGVQIGIIDGLAVSGSMSYVTNGGFFDFSGSSDVYIPKLDSVADLSLNAPKFKWSMGAEYHNAGIGLNARAGFRHVDGFRINSGVYIGSVPGYSTVDLEAGLQIPQVEGLSLTVTAQNLLTFVQGSDASPFEQRHREFVGVPEIGRLVLARLTYSFR